MQGSNSFRLIVRRGPQPNQIYDLNKGIVTLGRDITNDIVINDPEVSRHHCRFTQTPGGYTIEDLGSTNGTFVNGQRLTSAHPLSHGDTVGLGETVTLGYEGIGAPAAAAIPVPNVPPVGPMPSRSEYAPPSPYAQPQQAPGGYPGAFPSAPAPYGQPQQAAPQAGYDYEYQDEAYETPGARRWVVLGCGCFLVLCIVSSVIGGIIIDAKCWWDDIPVVSSAFDLGIRDDATCR
jgi:hypothetical protein